MSPASLERRSYGWFGSFQAMASPCEVHVADSDRAAAEAVVAAVASEAWRIEAKFSRYREGNIVDRINSSNGAAVEVDEETANLLTYADELFRLSDGLFDVTSGVLRRAWKFDGSDRIPDRKLIKRLTARVGWRHVDWARPHLKLLAGMEIDFGGIGKEYAVDRAGAIAARIWPRCLLNFGGDLLATGVPIDRGGWTVGIEGLSANTVPVQSIRLAQGGIATSGDARRFLLTAGKRYGHILDPRSGWPIQGAPRSVTVLAPSCTQAGMLATFAMLKGREAEAFLVAQDVKYWCLR